MRRGLNMTFALGLLFFGCGIPPTEETTSVGVLAQALDPNNHLDWANHLVSTIDPANNSYGSPATIHFAGYDGHSDSFNQSKCSPFVTELLKRAHNTDMVAVFGCNNPIADRYHDRIEAGTGFTNLTNISSIQAGDIVAITYNDAGCTNITCSSFQTCSSSGHVAVVHTAPTLRTATAPIVSGTSQYNVVIVDSSASYHGSQDTRYQAEAGGGHDSGVGRGTMRIYADSSGTITGYTWSTFSNSVYYNQSQRHLVVGRYN